MKTKIFKLVLLVIWLLIIFGFSNQTGQESSSVSALVINFLNHLFHIDLNNSFLDFTLIVRKCAHFTEFAILGILVFLNLKEYPLSRHTMYVLAILFCLLISITDEFHQTFIQDRSGNVADCFIDTLGSTFGILLTNVRKKRNSVKIF